MLLCCTSDCDCDRGCEHVHDCRLQGFLQVPVAGMYNFTLTSTDGSRLTLTPSAGNDLVLIDNNGPST